MEDIFDKLQNKIGFLGEIYFTFQELRNTFGEPLCYTGIDFDICFVIEYLEEIFLVCNYQNGKNYWGEDGLNPRAIKDWVVLGEKDFDKDFAISIIVDKIWEENHF